MAIYETGLLLDGKILLEKKYYDSSNQLDKTLRAGLLSAVDGFAKEAFDTELDSFTLSSYTLVAVSRPIEEPGEGGKKKPHTLMMFCIIEKDTDEKAVKSCMIDAVNQFTNRYSVNDILTKNTKHFKKFNKRFDKIFKDLSLKSEDRFSAIF
ncbi:MAG: hypothetical protein GF364_21795 [Candidatus Lokiarchaeota archaeon]|nr:hypothetical protein [Candidatus Lokiarchaeota archaeon]